MWMCYCVFGISLALIVDLLASSAGSQQYNLGQIIIHAPQLLLLLSKALPGSNHVHTYL
jgi:hypothetical protein